MDTCNTPIPRLDPEYSEKLSVIYTCHMEYNVMSLATRDDTIPDEFFGYID